MQEQGSLAVIIGIGINANVDRADLPPTGTSLLAETGTFVDRDELRRVILDALSVRYRELLEDRLDTRWATIQTHLAMLGDQVRVEDAGRTITGRLAGIDADGALVLNDGMRDYRVVAGDLSRGPKPVNPGEFRAQSGKPGILP